MPGNQGGKTDHFSQQLHLHVACPLEPSSNITEQGLCNRIEQIKVKIKITVTKQNFLQGSHKTSRCPQSLMNLKRRLGLSRVTGKFLFQFSIQAKPAMKLASKAGVCTVHNALPKQTLTTAYIWVNSGSNMPMFCLKKLISQPRRSKIRHFCYRAP